ncbi:hypothetical protein [Microvirga sp. TS319]|uniref:hypothetical protein n=1 Tax=Microvirga sp. TS319 TaxID=3241165 RepID=UPI003519F107
MAKGLLRFFGVVSVILGIGAILFGVLSGTMMIMVPWGIGLLLAGAPLLGFAEALELLADIAKNTSPVRPHAAPEAPQPQFEQGSAFKR